ncbi:MAG: cobalamin biosynthesis protein [Nitrososphaera sp.]
MIIALGAGIGLDYALGDPRNRYHPVAWLGRAIGFVIPRLESRSARSEKAKGAIFAIVIVAATGLGAYFLIYATEYIAGTLALVIASAIMLKLTIAVRGMERHAQSIMGCVVAGDLEGARNNLAMIVRRDTNDLSEQRILSATIECISESTVDGIISPIFYYSLFGPAGAVMYRTINTLDSMVGYKDDFFRNIGWMSARLDTLANYIPARLTAFLMIISAKIIGADWTNSLRMLQRDHTKTFSPNAGYPMATMAGALRIRLEKIGHYSLGDEQEPATIEKCRTAIAIMKLTTLLFCVLVSLPIMSILYLAGWWRLLFGIS